MAYSPPLDLRVINYVIENKSSAAVPCESDRKVHAKVCHLNRWRREVQDYRPELARLRFCRRKNPPRILIEYDMTYEVELEDGDGNPLGFSIADLDQQAEKERMERIQKEKEEQLANVSDREKERFLKDLAESTGLSVEAIREEVEGRSASHDAAKDDTPAEESLTEEQEAALAEAQRQKHGKELTEEERQHILNATAPAPTDADPFAEL